MVLYNIVGGKIVAKRAPKGEFNRYCLLVGGISSKEI